MAHDLKDTLQLPKTDFPMRAGLAQREPGRVAHWDKIGLYEAIQRKNSAGSPDKIFVLHDGPPFTNGDVHIGTALNKTLKDLILRYKSMRGYRTPYVPGWDCHGLPIEQKVSREIQDKKLIVTTGELRARCDAFAETWITKQTTQFKRLGVLADWKHEYKTKAPAFEADILRVFAAFVERGLVYRSKKPVYWSIPFETALAEAEIEYKDHVSPSIWVKFAVPPDEAKKFNLPTDKPLSVVIWTTTPWTIPANLAIAVHPDISYVVADIGTERVIVAEALLNQVATAAKLETAPTIVQKLPGLALEKLQPRHPFIDRASPVVLADYVTTETGTGAVHTAPGHGAEDYLTGLKYGLEIYCPVGDDGKYLDDGKIPADLVGLTTLESVEDLAAKRTSPANIAVLKKLDAAGALLAKQRFTHSYPHCWRSKTPIIFRAVDQWFVSLDRVMEDAAAGGQSSTLNSQLSILNSAPLTPRATAIASIKQVQFIPAWGEARLRAALESRPDWCISRQRSWGVPIPAFYDAKKNAYLDAGVARAVAAKIESRGTNFWYDNSAKQILEGVALPAGWPASTELTCGRDTLDVWIDSGSSHAAVLKNGQGGTHWPAELYLEGSDQHRGWFQSSLWTSVIAYDAAPYQALLTHGFIVGKDGKKISKSGQYEKPPTSDNYIAQYGADVIRLWIASQDFREDIRVSDLDKDLKNASSILNVVAESYRLIRNTLRYQLSNLFDFDHLRDAVPVEQMDTLDRWALHQTAALIRDCTVAYENYEFHRVYQLCNQFCSVTLSAVYHDILKDRLYTLGTNAPLRRSSQTAIYHVFQSLVKLLAPILTFTADEAWSYATAKVEYSDDSIHLQEWPLAPALWSNPALEADVAALLKVRSLVNEAIEPLRAAGKLGKSLDASVILSGSPEEITFQVLEKHRDFLAELFIVSHVTLAPVMGAAITASIRPSSELDFTRCPRCWRWVPTLEGSSLGLVCPRCTEALKP